MTVGKPTGLSYNQRVPANHRSILIPGNGLARLPYQRGEGFPVVVKWEGAAVFATDMVLTRLPTQAATLPHSPSFRTRIRCLFSRGLLDVELEYYLVMAEVLRIYDYLHGTRPKSMSLPLPPPRHHLSSLSIDIDYLYTRFSLISFSLRFQIILRNSQRVLIKHLCPAISRSFAPFPQTTTMALTVHHLQSSQSERVPWLCEELQIPYELVLHQRAPLMAPPELASLHPMGTAPVIVDTIVVSSSAFHPQIPPPTTHHN
jgi:hypothetical protein